jgi:predicted Holliday junction resolvase-like endonuclease
VIFLIIFVFFITIVLGVLAVYFKKYMKKRREFYEQHRKVLNELYYLRATRRKYREAVKELREAIEKEESNGRITGHFI